MLPQKVYGQRHVENTIPLSKNHNVLCLTEGPEKSYHKIVPASFSNSRLTTRTCFRSFHLLRISPNPREHSLGDATLIKDSSSHPPSINTWSTFFPLWPMFLCLTIHITVRRLPKACEHGFTIPGSSRRKVHTVHPTNLWVQAQLPWMRTERNKRRNRASHLAAICI